MKYVVIGGAGFIGSNLVDYLVEEDHEVSIIDNFSTGKKKNCNPKAIYHNLDISDYVLDTREKNTKYSLYATVNHYGSTGGGHYTAHCKNNGVWYNFNDSNVSAVSDTEELIDDSVYILFYKQKD